MERLKVTPGEWTVVHSLTKTAFNIIGTVLGGKYKIARSPYFTGVSEIIDEREKVEALANAILIADAGTTYNKCGKLPSELFSHREALIDRMAVVEQQNRELIEALKELPELLNKAYDFVDMIDPPRNDSSIYATKILEKIFSLKSILTKLEATPLVEPKDK